MAEDSRRLTEETLKELDKDRYYASLVLSGGKRDAVQALFAFSADVAAISERVHEPMAGEVRLQWWADALAGEGHGSVRSNPVADTLLDAIQTYRLPTDPLLRLLEARRFDLYNDPMPDMSGFEGYAGETVSILYQFAAMILNDGVEIAAADAAGHLGVAEALIGHMRAFGFNASRGRLFLPLAHFGAHGLSEDDIFSGQGTAAIAEALSGLREIAGEHLDTAEKAVRELPRSAKPAFAGRGSLRLYLKALKKGAAAPFAEPRAVPAWRRILALAFAA
jgi:15-cis-phytoene synthase